MVITCVRSSRAVLVPQMPKVPQDVELLLRDFIDSHDELETLLLLRSDRQRTWTLDEIAAKLARSTEEVRAALSNLTRGGLIGSLPTGFAYHPGELEAGVDHLASVWSESPLDVMKILNANALERVRTSAARAFADAFLVNRGKKDG